MEEPRKTELPRLPKAPDWAQEALAPSRPPFSASRKEVLLAFAMYVLAYVYLGSGWWALPLFVAGFLAAGEYLYRDVKRPWESWVWLACVIMIVGCITWRSLHPNQYDPRLDVQVMQEYAIPSSLAFLALHILAVYWLLCRSGRLTGGESGHLLPLDALYAFLIVPFQNFFLRIRCVLFSLKPKKERGVNAGTIAGAVLAAFAALVLLVLAMTQLSAADDTFGELIDDLRLEKAKELLKNTNKNMSYILDACGFGSEKTFYRTFHQKTGLTPKEFREKGQHQSHNDVLKGYLDFSIPEARAILREVIRQHE